MKAITFTTSLLVVYMICINLPLPFAIIFLVFLITTACLFWMVYSILTDTTDLSGKTFDDYFYEDMDQKRAQ